MDRGRNCRASAYMLNSSASSDSHILASRPSPSSTLRLLLLQAIHKVDLLPHFARPVSNFSPASRVFTLK